MDAPGNTVCSCMTCALQRAALLLDPRFAAVE
jgi:hypothetical protein